MRIISVVAENVKRLKVFYLRPKGNLIKITGGNGAGKSSVLDALFMALQGMLGAAKVPLRNGAERGAVRVTLGDGDKTETIEVGDVIVTRMWTKDGSRQGEMWVEGKDGMQFNRPQDVLDNLMGKISFDPLAFTRMQPKVQKEELVNLLGLTTTLSELKAKEKVSYDTRTESKKTLAALEAQRKQFQFPEGLPEKKYDIDKMVNVLASAANFNANIDREERERQAEVASCEESQRQIDEAIERVTTLRQEADELEAEAKQWKQTLKQRAAAIAKLKPLAEKMDAQKLSEEISTARAVNAAIDRRIEAAAKDEEIERVGKEVNALTRAIDKARKDQADAIASAKFPIEGLGFGDDEVLYNGLPLSEASSGEQMQVSVAMGMALNPKLRVMRIKDGSLLDDKALKALEEMADKNDFQVWLEITDTSGKVGVFLEDGEITAIDGEKPPPLPAPSLGPARKKAARKGKEASE